MIDLLVYQLVHVHIFGLFFWIISLIPLPPPFTQIAQVILAIILVLILVSILLGGVPLRPMLR